MQIENCKSELELRIPIHNTKFPIDTTTQIRIGKYKLQFENTLEKNEML